MVVVRANMGDGKLRARASMSVVFDNGDIHHFFALHDGVHHSWTRRYRGRYDEAVRSELERPNAVIVGNQHGGLHLLDGSTAEEETESLAG